MKYHEMNWIACNEINMKMIESENMQCIEQTENEMRMKEKQKKTCIEEFWLNRKTSNKLQWGSLLGFCSIK